MTLGSPKMDSGSMFEFVGREAVRGDANSEPILIAGSRPFIG
jgi:hypothetical protein